MERPPSAASSSSKSPKKRKTASAASSPSKSPKKSKTDPTTSLAELAAVEGLEETTPRTGIESAPTTAAPVTEVNESSSGVSNPNAGKDVIELPASSSNPNAGKDAEDANSNISSQDDDSNDSGLDTLPTPVKKQAGIERLQRGRKIKASSPAGRKYPTRFDLLFDLLFDFV